MKVVGITGSIGSGKSTVASLLEERGALAINADQIAREVTEPDTPAWREIVAHFGEAILEPDRKINRRKLGRIVFADAEELAFLERVVHPRVVSEIAHELKVMDGRFGNSKVVVLDVPLLFEVGLDKLSDITVVVIAEKSVRLKRLLNEGLSRDEAEIRITAQEYKGDLEKLADIIISNDGTLAELKEKVGKLWEQINR
ncbi:MAG TPA: dephospho-CoA kinase [Anaerolineae bacterium]|nr:dephospho-CoA kinase [Anaerolineae bacterium]